MHQDNKIKSLIQSLHRDISNEKKVVIYGPLKFPLKSRVTASAKIFVDRGIIHSKNPKNIVTIGDGDSSLKKMLIQFPKNKDKSDLSLAFNLIKHKNITIYLRGFFPINGIEKRFDHLLANLGEAYVHAKKKHNIIDFNKNIRIYPAGEHQLYFNGKFSLICFEISRLKLIGHIQFPISDQRKIQPLQSDLISNSAKGKFKLITNRPILLIRY